MDRRLFWMGLAVAVTVSGGCQVQGPTEEDDVCVDAVRVALDAWREEAAEATQHVGEVRGSTDGELVQAVARLQLAERAVGAAEHVDAHADIFGGDAKRNARRKQAVRSAGRHAAKVMEGSLQAMTGPGEAVRAATGRVVGACQ